MSFLPILLHYAPTEARLQDCAEVIELIETLVLHNFGVGYTVQLQGSYEQGLMLSSSDLDIVILAPGSTASSKKRQQSDLEDFVDFVKRNCKKLRIAQRILNASVPIVRLVARDSGIPLDVSAGDHRRGMCDKIVLRLLESDSTGLASAICRLVKIWTKQHPAVANAHHGALGSFGWVLLVIFFLQQRSVLQPYEVILAGSRSYSPPRSREECEKRYKLVDKKVLQLLVDFFAFVARIQMNQPITFSVMTGKRHPAPVSAPLVIEVPLLDDSNAARSLCARAWKQVILPGVLRSKEKLNAALHKPTLVPSALRSVFHPNVILGTESTDEDNQGEDSDIPEVALDSEAYSLSSDEDAYYDPQAGWTRSQKKRKQALPQRPAKRAKQTVPETPVAKPALTGLWAVRAQLAQQPVPKTEALSAADRRMNRRKNRKKLWKAKKTAA